MKRLKLIALQISGLPNATMGALFAQPMRVVVMKEALYGRLPSHLSSADS